jgi:stage III sporulation protein SpoIIIAA
VRVDLPTTRLESTRRARRDKPERFLPQRWALIKVASRIAGCDGFVNQFNQAVWIEIHIGQSRENGLNCEGVDFWIGRT